MENVEFSLKNDTISLTLENKITALVPVKTNFSGKNPSVNYVLEISSSTKSRLDFGSTM